MRKRGFVTGIPFFERRPEKPPREWSVVDYLPIEIPLSKSPHLPVIRFHGDVPCLHGENLGSRKCYIFTPREDFPLRLPKCMARTPTPTCYKRTQQEVTHRVTFYLRVSTGGTEHMRVINRRRISRKPYSFFTSSHVRHPGLIVEQVTYHPWRG